MRTIICGSRSVTWRSAVTRGMHLAATLGMVPTVILSGAARGADALGELFAHEHHLPLELYPANWEMYRSGAGFMRNHLMSTKADACVALWDGVSRGTEHMINCAKSRGLRVFVYVVEPPTLEDLFG